MARRYHPRGETFFLCKHPLRLADKAFRLPHGKPGKSAPRPHTFLLFARAAVFPRFFVKNDFEANRFSIKKLYLSESTPFFQTCALAPIKRGVILAEIPCLPYREGTTGVNRKS